MPHPEEDEACASIVSRAGVRTALPKRSDTTSTAVGHNAWVSASSGTDMTVIAYPAIEASNACPFDRRPVPTRAARYSQQPCQTGDETDEPGGCAEGCEVRSDDGAGAFIHEIDKHADDAERDHEAQRR